jgi:hypothetical protein
MHCGELCFSDVAKAQELVLRVFKYFIHFFNISKNDRLHEFVVICWARSPF